MADNIEGSATTEKLNILLLDDENDILKSLNRVLRLDYNVFSFNEGKDALSCLKVNDIAIIISDMRMPEMDGADFLSVAREIQPDSVRILLTGYSDIQSTIRAVNAGGIHTYISKPWDNDNLKLIVAKSAEFYRLTKEKKRLNRELEKRNIQLEDVNQALKKSNFRLKNFNNELEKKVKERTKDLQTSNLRLEALLKNRNKTFKDILSMVSAIIHHSTGYPVDHTERIANQAKAVATRLNRPEAEIGYIYLCGLMHQIGLVGAKEDELDLSVTTSDSNSPNIPNVNPEVGALIVGRLKHFEPMVEIIKHQDELYNGTGKPDHLSEDDIPVGSRIIKVVKDYDFFVSSPYNPNRITPQSAQKYLKDNAGKFYDPDIVQVFLSIVSIPEETEKGVELCVGLSEVKLGMIVSKDLYLPNGNLMLTAGNAISAVLLTRLQEIEKKSSMPISVYIDRQ